MYEKRFLWCGVVGVIEAGSGRVDDEGTPGGVVFLEGSCIDVEKS